MGKSAKITLTMSQTPLIVTHHAPDLDAVTSVWLLKRFDAHKFANAPVTFVNPGETISDQELARFENISEVVHVDTGLGEFDHHQPERAKLPICAASLVMEHLVNKHPDLSRDSALISLVNFVNEIDHFGEIFWPEADSDRYAFMVHELIKGVEAQKDHDDLKQLEFGMQCLNSAYAVLKDLHKARKIVQKKGIAFTFKSGQAMAVETRNDAVIKLAQKMGYTLVVRKDEEEGHVRIKARPDSDIDLKALYEKIKQVDKKGTWFYHHSGKMLLNGSSKHRDQVPTELSLTEIVKMIKEIY